MITEEMAPRGLFFLHPVIEDLSLVIYISLSKLLSHMNNSLCCFIYLIYIVYFSKIMYTLKVVQVVMLTSCLYKENNVQLLS